MKKTLIVPLVLATLVLGSCSPKKSQPYVMTFGSFESNYLGGTTLIGPQGETYVRDASSTIAMPSYTDLTKLNLSRVRAYFEYQTIEGREKENPRPMTLHHFESVPTLILESTGYNGFDDPILSLGSIPSFSSNHGGEVKSTLSTVQNYLDVVGIFFDAYPGADAQKSLEVAFEIDPTPVPGIGTAPDTLNLYMRFLNNKGATEDRSDSYYLGDNSVAYRTLFSVDLAQALSDFSIPITEGGENITYILKLNYTVYKEEEKTSEETVQQYQTVKWVPGKPYLALQ
jgi:hypothetical protein